MNQPDNTCVQRWFAELTGYETCHECKGLIVEEESDHSSCANSPAPSSPHSPNSPHTPHSPHFAHFAHFAHSPHYPHSSRSPHSPHSPTSPSRARQQDSAEPLHPSLHHLNTPATTTESTVCSPHDHIGKECLIVCRGEAQAQGQAQALAQALAQAHHHTHLHPHQTVCNTRMTTRGLRDFYPGFILPAPGPCTACRRVEGPHPTKCPGCNHKYRLQQAENPRPPCGYVGKRPPFGQAGWRVARGHRQPKPVTLHGYGCYMQRKLKSYGGSNSNAFTHLGQPPSVLVNFKNCPRM